MTTLRSIPVGARFLFRDKFDHGWVRDQTGVKIGETIDIWDAVQWDRKLHHNPATGEVRMSWTGPGYSLCDSRITVAIITDTADA